MINTTTTHILISKACESFYIPPYLWHMPRCWQVRARFEGDEGINPKPNLTIKLPVNSPKDSPSWPKDGF